MKFRLFSILAVALSLILAISASAQSVDDSWTDPANLSNSGSTSEPAIVTDNNGNIHVVWQDAYAGIVYSKFDDDQWSEPVVVDFPFEETTPYLVTGNRNVIHAFWKEESNVEEEIPLLYSRVPADDFGNVNAWQPPVIVAQSATAFDVRIDDNDVIHLTYIRPLQTSEFPSGVYYRRSNDVGITWTSASILEQSPYFRSLGEKDVRISISSVNVNNTNKLFVAWDNISLGRIYYIDSSDDGVNWGSSVEVDRPEIETGTEFPYDPHVIVHNDQIIIKWQEGDRGSSCSHFYQLSLDNGFTWGEQQQMLEDVTGCSQESNFFATNDGLLLLQTMIQDQVYLLAWDGNQWSIPQLQLPLLRFVDPETYRYINFGCRQYDYHAIENRLLTVGCEIGGDGEGIGDIWITSMQVGDVNTWFPPPSIWAVPVELTSVTGEIQSPQIVIDGDRYTHTFWTQVSDGNQGSLDSNINVSSWDGDFWTLPVALFTDFSNSATHPSVALEESGILYMVWNDLQSGEIYVSWTDSEQASRRAEWVEPKVLPTFGVIARSPEIYIDASGAINVAYLVPLNAARGVYLTSSIDGGQTWLDPVRVFDAEFSGWDMVDQLSISGTLDGKIHLLWTQNTLPDVSGPLSLYYTSSEDGGLTWPAPEIVVDVPTDWNQILGYGKQTVHRLWEEISGGHAFVYHQVSYDGGLSWTPATSISSFGMPSGKPTVTIDDTGQLHLLQIFQEEEEGTILRNWQWDGERWFAGEILNVGGDEAENFPEIAADVSPDASLEVIYSAANVSTGDGDINDAVYYSSRSVADALIDSIPLATSDIIPTPTFAGSTPATVTSTEEESPTPTINPADVNPTPTANLSIPQPNPSSPAPQNNGIIYGGIIAGVIVLVIFIVFIIRRFLPK